MPFWCNDIFSPVHLWSKPLSPFILLEKNKKIVRTTLSDCSHSCEEHEACGSNLTAGDVVRLQKVQVVVDRKEETTIAVYWVTDGIDRCRIRFLPHHMTKHTNAYHGLLAHVMDVFTQLSASPTKRKNIITTRGVQRQ